MVEERNPGGVLEFKVYSLLRSLTVSIRDTKCVGSRRSMSPEERMSTTQLVLP
jgi:hypothetical protein